jgi:phage-related tail fiber protein
MSDFYSIPTNACIAAEASAMLPGGAPIQLSTLVFGDGNGAYVTPNSSQTALVNQVASFPVNSLSVDPVNPGWLIVEVVIPPTSGGWYYGEWGVLDHNGVMMYVGNCARRYKPVLTQGEGSEIIFQARVVTANAANVQLLIDPSVVLATQTSVSQSISAHSSAADPHGDRAAASTALSNGLQAHTNANDPHGDRAFAQTATNSSMQGHLSQLDPHGDRAYANQSLANHLTATDPHGDRAYTAAQVKNAFARAYFFAGH